ncbi:MAG: prepilin peptidase [Corynebacterium glucuronolyticum]|nr:prepilin peptidase [Mycobacteriaceae bacterium]MDY5834958.1 prepilin peptidase [Corynebacterium glucuronolyticum]
MWGTLLVGSSVNMSLSGALVANAEPSAFGQGASVLIFLWMCLLVGWDVCFHRLPDWLTIPAWGILPILWVFLDVEHVGSRIVGGIVWLCLYVLVGAVTGGVGGGDLKLAFPLGQVVGLSLVLPSIAVAAVMTLVLARPGQRVAHGPAMIVASVGCLLLF